MFPTLLKFELGGMVYNLSSYNFFLILSILSVVLISMPRIRSVGISYRKACVFMTVCIIATFIGARGLNVISESKSLQELFSMRFNNFSMLGGLIFAAITAFIFLKWTSLSFWKLGDTLVPGVSVGIILTRVGCFLNGCCFGKITDAPWGVVYPRMSIPHLNQLQNGDIVFFTSQALKVHPTQLYEILAVLIGLVGALWIEKQKNEVGKVEKIEIGDGPALRKEGKEGDGPARKISKEGDGLAITGDSPAITAMRFVKFKEGTAIAFAALWYSTFRIFNSFFREKPIGSSNTEHIYYVLYFACVIFCFIALVCKIKQGDRNLV